MSRIYIDSGAWVDSRQLRFETSGSSGPGGQHVNTADTRVTVLLDVSGCEGLSQQHKRLVMSRLSGRINKQGVLRISSQKHRSQSANRDEAVQKLIELLRRALKRKPPRKKTAVPRRAKEKRLAEKKKRSLRKQKRQMKDLPREFLQ